MFSHKILPEPLGVTFDCGLVLETVVLHGCNAFWNYMKSRVHRLIASVNSPGGKFEHLWKTYVWRNTVKTRSFSQNLHSVIKEEYIDLRRPITFQMAVFPQVNWWLSQSETLHHLLLGWSAVIADFWCRYQIVTSGKTNWTYADSGQPSGFLILRQKKIPDENKWSICVYLWRLYTSVSWLYLDQKQSRF